MPIKYILCEEGISSQKMSLEKFAGFLRKVNKDSVYGHLTLEASCQAMLQKKDVGHRKSKEGASVTQF